MICYMLYELKKTMTYLEMHMAMKESSEVRKRLLVKHIATKLNTFVTHNNTCDTIWGWATIKF